MNISTAIPRRATQRGQWRTVKNDARSRTARPQWGQFAYETASPGDPSATEALVRESPARVASALIGDAGLPFAQSRTLTPYPFLPISLVSAPGHHGFGVNEQRLSGPARPRA